MLGKFPTKFSSYEIWEGTCLSHLDLPNHGGPCQTLDTIGMPFGECCALSWFHNVSTPDAEVIEY